MARSKPPVSYDDDVALPATPPNVGAFRPTPDQKASETEGEKSGRRPILEKSAPTLVYLHPSGKHQLRQYAVTQGLKVKVHDLLLEAIEEWGAKRGLNGPWRVSPSKPHR